jgi:uncharacterized protein
MALSSLRPLREISTGFRIRLIVRMYLPFFSIFVEGKIISTITNIQYMSLTERINNDIKEAMKAREKEKLEALRDIKAKLLLEATSGADGVTEAAENKIVLKLHKQRMESYEIFKQQGREDLAEAELFQSKVIEAYLPKMMSEDEIRAAVREKMAAVGATGPQDLPKVMGPIMGQLNGKADGKVISEIVKQELNK